MCSDECGPSDVIWAIRAVEKFKGPCGRVLTVEEHGLVTKAWPYLSEEDKTALFPMLLPDLMDIDNPKATYELSRKQFEEFYEKWGKVLGEPLRPIKDAYKRKTTPFICNCNSIGNEENNG